MCTDDCSGVCVCMYVCMNGFVCFLFLFFVFCCFFFLGGGGGGGLRSPVINSRQKVKEHLQKLEFFQNG